MNWRQKRKAFKKKYGVTPEQAGQIIIETLNKFDWQKLADGILDTYEILLVWSEEIKNEINQQSTMHQDGDYYIKSIDVERIINNHIKKVEEKENDDT